MAMLVSLDSKDFKISWNMTEEGLPLSVLRFVEIRFHRVKSYFSLFLYNRNIKFLSFLLLIRAKY